MQYKTIQIISVETVIVFDKTDSIKTEKLNYFWQ